MARILVAEDNGSVRDFVERGLVAGGHVVTAVNDGGAALEALQRDRFDLLLTDIVMPVMDGIALALLASDEFPDMPVLMMSGFSHERQRAYNLSELIQDVLEKPFALSDLLAAVDKALAGA